MISELLQEGGLSLERLESFCLVAEAGGVTKAAKGDPVRQSLYSRQIKELEEFFGTELVRRKGRGIALTEAGVRLNKMARESFAALWDFKSGCKGLPIEIVVGAGESLIRWLLMPRLGEIRRRLPNVRFKLLNLTSADIVARLADGMMDFGVVRKDVVRRPLRSVALGNVEYSVFVPKAVQSPGQVQSPKSKVQSPLPIVASGESQGGIVLREGLRLGERLRLRSRSGGLGASEHFGLATLEGEGSFRRELAAIERRHKLKLDIQLECSSFPLVAAAVESGGMAAILPSIARVELGLRGVQEVKVAELGSLAREICLAWNHRVLRIRPALERAKLFFTELVQCH
ncbi:MAG: hypothetical protein C5B50_28145 [Verrucomicrobia bacterium]|nr:MAG: hypothetical protein C5B50_28145 [Verrucomicrobiota bacterium]